MLIEFHLRHTTIALSNSLKVLLSRQSLTKKLRVITLSEYSLFTITTPRLPPFSFLFILYLVLEFSLQRSLQKSSEANKVNILLKQGTQYTEKGSHILMLDQKEIRFWLLFRQSYLMRQAYLGSTFFYSLLLQSNSTLYLSLPGYSLYLF